MLEHYLLAIITGVISALLVSAFLALACPAKAGLSTGSIGSRATHQIRDRSIEAVTGQMKAMGVAVFDLLINDAKTGKRLRRRWNRDELTASVPWLKRMNAIGHEIHIRPARPHGTHPDCRP